MKANLPLATAFLAAASLVALPSAFATESDTNAKTEGDITITVKKSDRDEGKKEVYEAGLEDLIKQGKDPVAAFKIYEFYHQRVIHLNDEVTESEANRVIYEMKVLDGLKPGEPITLQINSPGGSVYDGLRIYNTMQTLESPTHTVCNGKAASMAAVLLIAGKERTAMPACRVMIHEVSAGTSGKTGDMSYAVRHFEDLQGDLYRIIGAHSGLPFAEIAEIGDAEVFYSGPQAKELGFVDKVVEPRHTPDGTAEPRTIPPDLMPRRLIGRWFDDSEDHRRYTQAAPVPRRSADFPNGGVQGPSPVP